MYNIHIMISQFYFENWKGHRLQEGWGDSVWRGSKEWSKLISKSFLGMCDL